MGEPALELGIVCGQCDVVSPLGTRVCAACGHDLRLFPGKPSVRVQMPSIAPPEPVFEDEHTVAFESPEAGSQTGEIDRVSVDVGRIPAGMTEEERMDQARNYVCESCMSPVPSGHKFCGRCGTPVPDHILHLQANFFSDMQDPEKARIVVIRGQDRHGGEQEGLSYHLKADQHLAGHGLDLDFSDDPFVSPKHANFFYRSGGLVVRDEGSLNGVFFRIRGGVEIAPGDTFMAGEQLFRLDPTPKASDGNDAEGTFFYSSPKYPSAFRINQLLEGGAIGMTVCARGNTLDIGREDGDLNFPGDVFMSAKHCTLEEKDGKFVLTDHGSRNGTYIRIKSEKPLAYGDYLFLGKKLVRVEMNSN